MIRRVLALSLLMFTFTFGLSVHSLPATPGEFCSDSLESDSMLLNTAAHNIYSFSYIREAMATLKSSYPGAQFCLSGLAVARNAYQYPQFYMQLIVRVDGKPVHEMNFLYQDASVQALDNVGEKPWIGLPEDQSESILTSYATGRDLTQVAAPGAFDVLKIAQASGTYTHSESVDLKTLSLMRLNIEDPREFYIVSWLTLPGNNPFATFVTLKAVLIVRNPADNSIAISENLWLTNDVIAPLGNLLESNFVPTEQRVQALVDPTPKRTAALLAQ